jgi:hypothetical protein
MSQYQGEYETFFKSPAGLQCLTTISALIDSNHQQAENQPDNARDFMQRAKGNREVLNHINSVLNSGKTNPYSKAGSEQ